MTKGLRPCGCTYQIVFTLRGTSARRSPIRPERPEMMTTTRTTTVRLPKEELFRDRKLKWKANGWRNGRATREHYSTARMTNERINCGLYYESLCLDLWIFSTYGLYCPFDIRLSYFDFSSPPPRLFDFSVPLSLSDVFPFRYYLIDDSKQHIAGEEGRNWMGIDWWEFNGEGNIIWKKDEAIYRAKWFFAISMSQQ